MKRENTVRSGARTTNASIAGNTRGIHAVAQGLPGAKRFCISMHTWTACDPTGAINRPISHGRYAQTRHSAIQASNVFLCLASLAMMIFPVRTT